MKEKFLIIYGGKSVEHDISVITALQVMRNLPDGYDFLPVYIDRDGIWWTAENLNEINIYDNFHKHAKKPTQVTFSVGENLLLLKRHKKFLPYVKVKAVLNCCHGATGEDGCLAGLLNCCFVPYTSCDVVSSALCMDKAVMKDILKANKISSASYLVLKYQQYDIENVLKKVKFPVIVKPSTLGSSIGITVCKNKKQFVEALDLAFSFDHKVLVEKLVENLREFNCACFMLKEHLFTSFVNEVTNKGEIYSFEDKYLASETNSHEAEKNLAKKIKMLTEKIYNLFDCSGVVRVDFLYDEKEKVLYVNEINSIPGSLGFYLFKDLPFKELVCGIIDQTLLKEQEEKKLVKTFPSQALKIFQSASCHTKK